MYTNEFIERNKKFFDKIDVITENCLMQSIRNQLFFTRQETNLFTSAIYYTKDILLMSSIYISQERAQNMV